MLTAALRQLGPLGRTAGAITELFKVSDSASSRAFAAAPKQTLEVYVENIRKEIADSYEDLVLKHEAYKSKFSELVSTSGVPRTSDFASVVDWTNKTAAIFKEVKYPERAWQLTADKVSAIQAQLKSIPAEKKAFAAEKSEGPAPWHLSLSDAQIAEISKSPRIFRELEKLHNFEEKLKARAVKDAQDRGVPLMDLDTLPSKLDLDSEYTLNSKEAQWCVEKAKTVAADLIKNDPMIRDPFSSAQFKEILAKNAEKYGIPASKVDDLWQRQGKALGFI